MKKEHKDNEKDIKKKIAAACGSNVNEDGRHQNPKISIEKTKK